MGKRFQIFLDASEIEEWCSKLCLRLCLDTSHSKLYCNYGKKNFRNFIEKLLPFTAHIHLGDAERTNGEGLQIGEGDINFKEFCSTRSKKLFSIDTTRDLARSQNNGVGFAFALAKMEELSR